MTSEILIFSITLFCADNIERSTMVENYASKFLSFLVYPENREFDF